MDEISLAKEFGINPQKYLLTSRDLVYDSIYTKRNYSELESFDIKADSLTPLKMVYRCSVDDTITNLSFTIGGVLKIAHSAEDGEEAFNLLKSGFEGAFNPEGEGSRTLNLDSMLSFGDYSEFRGYAKDDDIFAYSFFARCGELVFLSTFASGCACVDFKDFLEKKLRVLNESLPERSCELHTSIDSPLNLESH